MVTMLDTLLELRALKGKYKCRFGVCSYLGNAGHYAEEENLEKFFVTWPNYSGDKRYPVPPGQSKFSSAREAYNMSRAEDMWNPDHPYGALRWELVDHLIKELSNG